MTKREQWEVLLFGTGKVKCSGIVQSKLNILRLHKQIEYTAWHEQSEVLYMAQQNEHSTLHKQSEMLTFGLSEIICFHLWHKRNKYAP